MAPSQTATSVINICATVWAVVIHAPSSKPACTAPRMSAIPSDDTRVVRVEMNVPRSTAKSPSQGMEVGGGGDAAAGAGVGSLIDAHPSAYLPSRPPTYPAEADPRAHPHRQSQSSPPPAARLW